MKFYGRPGTIKVQKCLFEKWVDPMFTHPITEEDLDDAVNTWQQMGLKPNTVRSLVSITRKYAAQTGSPIVTTHRIQTNMINPVGASKVLTKVQARQLLENVKHFGSLNEYFAICLGYHAGLRKGEVFGLEWEDIDWHGRKLMIKRSYDGPTKNGKNRIVPMGDALWKVLFWKSPINAKGAKGKICKPFNPGPLLRKACKDANIPTITFHGLRHTFATLALNSGLSIKEVQEMLGHSKASTTIDIYWNHVPTDITVDFT